MKQSEPGGQLARYLGEGVFSEFRAHTIQQRTLSSAHGDKAALAPRSRSLSPWVFQSCRQKLPQAPPNPARFLQQFCELLFHPATPSPGSSQPRSTHSWGSGPQRLLSPGSANPSPSFCPCSPQEKQETLRPRQPLTVSSSLPVAALRRLQRPSPGPRPASLPPSLQPRTPGPAAAPAAAARPLSTRCAQPARPSWPRRPLPPLRPQPSAAQTGGDQLGGGGGSARGMRPGRAEPAQPLLPPRPSPPPHLARRRGRVPWAREGRRAAGTQPPGAVPLGPRWWAPRGSVLCPGPLRNHRGGHRGTRSSEVGEGARQFAVGAFTAAAGVWLVSPSRGASFSEPRLQPRGRNLVAGFPNELEEGGWVHVLEQRFPRPTVRFLPGNSR